MIKRVLAIAALAVVATSTTACSPLAAICGAWLATPCIICLGDGTPSDNPPPRGAVDVDLGAPLALPATIDAAASTPAATSSTMQY